MRRFIVLVNGETPQNVSSLIEYATQEGFGWWHWIDNAWLLTTRNTQLKADHIRDKFRSLSGDKWVVVIEVEHVTWATYGPVGKKKISKWIKEQWSKL